MSPLTAAVLGLFGGYHVTKTKNKVKNVSKIKMLAINKYHDDQITFTVNQQSAIVILKRINLSFEF
jgi:hypothetical protein